jgi:hypothetical protein
VSREQRAESRDQRAESRQYRADNIEQSKRVGSREQTPESTIKKAPQ